jgi:hypothetical protein
VASTIGLLELAAQGRQMVDYTAQPSESFIAVTLAYVLVNLELLAVEKLRSSFGDRSGRLRGHERRDVLDVPRPPSVPQGSLAPHPIDQRP